MVPCVVTELAGNFSVGKRERVRVCGARPWELVTVESMCAAYATAAQQPTAGVEEVGSRGETPHRRRRRFDWFSCRSVDVLEGPTEVCGCVGEQQRRARHYIRTRDLTSAFLVQMDLANRHIAALEDTVRSLRVKCE